MYCQSVENDIKRNESLEIVLEFKAKRVRATLQKLLAFLNTPVEHIKREKSKIKLIAIVKNCKWIFVVM